jgi:hypothetical protein
MDRGKKGSKRMLLVDGCGVPLSIVVTAANRHDVTQRFRTLLVRYEKTLRSYSPSTCSPLPSSASDMCGEHNTIYG